MKLCVSNLAWKAERDEEMYAYLSRLGIAGLEIAPSRLFGENPYCEIEAACRYCIRLQAEYGLRIVSMQSIWYGRSENMFVSQEERNELIAYTRQAIDFAAAIGCPVLVFGCPRNRRIGSRIERERGIEIAVQFFAGLGQYAFEHGTMLALEPNPACYGTDFLNTTTETFSFLQILKEYQKSGLRGVGMNLDVGALLANGEDANCLKEWISQIRHVHISEPGLELIGERTLHRTLISLLEKEGYKDWISMEVGPGRDFEEVKRAIFYFKKMSEPHEI